jgi:hypothetical protein
MDDLDRLLRDAGARWRASQPPPPEVDDVALANTPRSTFGWGVVAAAGAIGAGAMLVAVLALGVWTQMVDRPRIGTGGSTASPTASQAIVAEACSVTRPNPPFAAPSPYPSSPPDDRYAWFGSPALWTMLELDGEVWDAANAAFPVSQKLFWWSSNWAGMRADPAPVLTVVATRLDGPGSVRTDHATNASADSLGGQAMLAGIEFPTAGCWQLTAQYGDAVLSYIVWITDH